MLRSNLGLAIFCCFLVAGNAKQDATPKKQDAKYYIKKYAEPYIKEYAGQYVPDVKHMTDGAAYEKMYAPCALKKSKDEIADCFIRQYAGKDIANMVDQKRAAKEKAKAAAKKAAKAEMQKEAEAVWGKQASDAAQSDSAKAPSPEGEAEKAPAPDAAEAPASEKSQQSAPSSDDKVTAQDAAKAPAPEKSQQSAPSSADKATNLVAQKVGISNSAVVFVALACVMSAAAFGSFISIQRKNNQEASHYLLVNDMA